MRNIATILASIVIVVLVGNTVSGYDPADYDHRFVHVAKYTADCKADTAKAVQKYHKKRFTMVGRFQEVVDVEFDVYGNGKMYGAAWISGSFFLYPKNSGAARILAELNPKDTVEIHAIPVYTEKEDYWAVHITAIRLISSG